MSGKIAELIKRIDDQPDKLHGDYTPAGAQLIDLGEPALAPVLDLMLAEDGATRMRAQRVLEGITMKTYGFVQGKGWMNAIGETRWRDFWLGLGNLDWEASKTARERSVSLWRHWLAERARDTEKK